MTSLDIEEAARRYTELVTDYSRKRWERTAFIAGVFWAAEMIFYQQNPEKAQEFLEEYKSFKP